MYAEADDDDADADDTTVIIDCSADSGTESDERCVCGVIGSSMGGSDDGDESGCIRRSAEGAADAITFDALVATAEWVAAAAISCTGTSSSSAPPSPSPSSLYSGSDSSGSKCCDEAGADEGLDGTCASTPSSASSS